MNNSSKSPIKNNAKSISSLPRSQNKLVHSPKTPSNLHSQVKREIFNSQVYKTILTKLLSKNTVEDFLHQAFKFTIINDEFSLPYIKKQHLTHSSSKDFPQLGKSFLKDGSFLKHYCTLLLLKQPDHKNRLKRRFYQRYKDEVVEKKGFFQRFFKVQIKIQQDQTLQNKLETSRKNIAYSLKKTALSLKKAVTEKMQISQKYQQILETLSAIDPKQPKQDTVFSQMDYSQRRIIKKQFAQQNIAKPTKQKQNKNPNKIKNQQDIEEFIYIFCRSKSKSKKNIKETEQERQKRLLGLVTSKSKKSQRKNQNVSKFADDVKSDKKLKQIYQSIKKERQQLTPESINKSNKTQLQVSPIYRQKFRHLKTQFQSKSLKQLTTQLIEKITSEERSLLEYFPNIKKIGFRNKVQKDSPIILGLCKNKILMKSFIVDYSSCIEPTLIAVYLEPQNDLQAQFISQFKKQIDKDVEVLLVDQFSTLNEQKNSK